MFLFKYNLDRSTTHPKFDPTGIQTHDLQIMTVKAFHVTETAALTTQPSVTVMQDMSATVLKLRQL